MEIEEELAREFAPALNAILKLDRRGLLELVESLEGELAKGGDQVYRGILLIILGVCERRLIALSADVES